MEFHHPLSVTMATTMSIGSFKRQADKMINPDKSLALQIWNANYETYLKIINSPHWLFTDSPRLFDNPYL